MCDPNLFMRKVSAVVLATLLVAACQSTDPNDPNAKAKQGAGAGAVAGAIVGAIVGNQSGNSRTGAVIGAAVGAAVGGAVGHDMDKQQRELQQIPNVEVTRPSQNEIDVQLPSDVLFDLNSADLRPEAQNALRDLAANFSRYPNERIDVEGFTDATGTELYNLDLSQRRADAVRNYLVDHGVLAQNIFSRGWGAQHPKATNDTPEGRQANRRVEIHIQGNQ